MSESILKIEHMLEQLEMNAKLFMIYTYYLQTTHMFDSWENRTVMRVNMCMSRQH